jgi:hypothetical protein
LSKISIEINIELLKMNIIKSCANWNSEIFEHLSQKLKTKNNFKFWLRRRNTNERLDNGFWFNGTDKYIHIGITKVGSGNLSTQSIGFVIHDIDSDNVWCGIEILFRGEKRQNFIDCYSNIADELGGFNKKNKDQFFKAYSGDIWSSLDDFFLVQYPKIMKVINECGLSDELEIEEEDFEKSLNKILQKKKELALNDSIQYWLLIANSLHHEYESLLIKDYKTTWALRSLNDTNPKLNDIFLICDPITNFIYAKGTVLSNQYLKKYSETNLGRSIKSDKIDYPAIDIIINEQINYKNLLLSKHNLLKTKSHKLILKEDFFDLLNKKNDMPELNQIFFGPPGTGKTYNTINEAIKIADPEFYKVNHDNRDELKKRFKLLLLNNDNENVGQIGFTTFHQSMSYEDFIEGIKPVQPIATDTYLKYEIQEGIFKRICRIANDSINAVDVKPDSLLSLSQDEFDKAHFYKMSLGNSQSDLDNEIYDYCIQNNCIALGWGDGYDYTGKDEKSIKEFATEKGIERFSVTAINQFKILLKVGDYVIISNGNYYVRAIGKVVGEYEFREESPFANNPTYNQFRNVEWVFTDKSIPATEIYNKNLSQQTIYQLIKNEIKQEFFVKDKKVDLVKLPKNPKNYVLIIDEINRGNVSSIFGELITLIEKDKRAGTDEELSVVLPYSKKEFKVPQNVFIIGTMNTADRSIEALDTALRRRFSFREMPPKPELILQEGKLKDKNGKIDDIDVVEILKVMNDRIEKLIDKDHKIGHSYFLGIETLDELKQAFKDKVIPLLEEYFFGDFGKISLVLGSSFITKSSKSGVLFAKNNEYDPSVANDLLERGVYEITTTDNWDFKAIYQ